MLISFSQEFRSLRTAEKLKALLPLTPALLASMSTLVNEMNGNGLCVVAAAVRTLAPRPEPYGRADEAGLTLAGFIGFLVPPKASTAEALRLLRRNELTVKVLTGDSEIITAKVCHECGPARGRDAAGPVHALQRAR